MKFLLSIVSIALGCSFGTAQFYFNTTYDNTNAYAELSAHISVLDNGNYLVPSVSVNEEAFRYHWRILNQEGLEILYSVLMDSSSTLYSGSSNCFLQLSDGNFLQSIVTDSPGLMKFNDQGELLWQLEIDSIIGASNAMLELSDTDIFFLAA